MRRFLGRYQYELCAIAGTVLVLWGMLLPGYILTLDMAWVPHVPLVWNGNGLNNAYPVSAFFHALSFLVPGWVGQKVMLVALFFLLFYLPMRFLPLLSFFTPFSLRESFREEKLAKIFAGALYALNPFVYTRMLAGQWLVLFGYALLPLVFFTLERFTKEPNKKSAAHFGLALALMGLFSIHFLFLSLFVSCIWIIAHIARVLWKREKGVGTVKKSTLKSMLNGIFLHGVYAGSIFLLVSSYWIVPALFRHTPVESRFDISHFQAFAAGANGDVPALLNTAVLGGYWGEGNTWNLYFLWPQAQPLFWIAAFFLAQLVVFGMYVSLKDARMRFSASVLVVLGVLAYITALGAGDTLFIFKNINLFLYTHVPLWSGLRDSQKIDGVLALVYVTFAAVAMSRFLALVSGRRYVRIGMFVAALVLPAVFGMYEWQGFHRQLQPTDFPSDWYTAKALIDDASATAREGKVLVLPWHGYLSLDFDHQLIVSNPGPAFFGIERTIASKSIDINTDTNIGTLHDQEIDPQYRDLDAVFASQTPPTPDVLEELLHRNAIGFIVIIKNRIPPSEPNWTDMPEKTLDNLDGNVLLDSTVYVKSLIYHE